MFEKNFYLEHPALTSRPDALVTSFRAAREISVSGHDVPKPCTSFEEASFPDYVLTELLNAGFDSPSPVQSQGWPIALQGGGLYKLNPADA